MEKTTTMKTATAHTGTPATTPMNLRCATVQTGTDVADSDPSQVMILINPKGDITPPPASEGWTEYAPSAGKTWQLENESNHSEHWPLKNMNVRIYVK